MAIQDMQLAGICRGCMKRLGVDERVTVPLQYIQFSQLPEWDPKAMSGVQFPGASHGFGLGRGGHHGTTKITYKIAKTVKESIDDTGSASGSHGKNGTSGKKEK